MNSNPSKKTQLPKGPPKKNISPVTWQSLGVIALLGGSVAMYVHLEREKKKQELEKKRSETAGKAAIGGAFTLTDMHGKPFSNTDLAGGWSLIYFGFTFCPDICPEELDKMTEAVTELDNDPDLPQVKPIMISIDPDRDTPEKLAEYLQDFHPRLIGLTGTMDEVRAVAKLYRVYFSRPLDDDSEDYLVDHSIIMYLMNPEGEFVQHYGTQYMSAFEVVKGIKKDLKKEIALRAA